MSDIIKKLNQRISHWQGLSVRTNDIMKATIYEAKANEAKKIKEIILSSQKDISQILTDIYNEHPYKVIGDTDTYNQYNEGWSDACNKIESTIIN